jgi:hypothetical protein
VDMRAVGDVPEDGALNRRRVSLFWRWERRCGKLLQSASSLVEPLYFGLTSGTDVAAKQTRPPSAFPCATSASCPPRSPHPAYAPTFVLLRCSRISPAPPLLSPGRFLHAPPLVVDEEEPPPCKEELWLRRGDEDELRSCRWEEAATRSSSSLVFLHSDPRSKQYVRGSHGKKQAREHKCQIWRSVLSRWWDKERKPMKMMTSLSLVSFLV